MTVMSKPKNAVTMIAQGLLFDVWALRGDQVGIVSRKSGDLVTIDEGEWRRAIGRRPVNPVNPSLAEVSAIDAACRSLVSGDRGRMASHPPARLHERAA